ncbi:MAG: hypothetical protein JJ895_07605 [Balneolaceae bacterium]|nr:hypothetical protein [Balneolaceae bacterium]
MAYSRKEISSILSKAAEIELSKTLNNSADELTDTELLELAKEVGISESSMKAAIESAKTPQFDNTFSWLKGTSRLQHSEVFNVPFQKEHMAKVLQLLQNNYNELGETEVHANSLIWDTSGEASTQKFTLKEEDGKTALTFSSDWTTIKFITALFPFLLTFIITLITVKGMGYDKFTAIAFAPLGGFVGLGGAWLYLRHRFNQQKALLNNTLTKIRSLLYSKKEPTIKLNDHEEVQDTENYTSNRAKG